MITTRAIVITFVVKLVWVYAPETRSLLTKGYIQEANWFNVSCELRCQFRIHNHLNDMNTLGIPDVGSSIYQDGQITQVDKIIKHTIYN